MSEREPSILREAPAGADNEASRSEPGEPATGAVAEQAGSGGESDSKDKTRDQAGDERDDDQADGERDGDQAEAEPDDGHQGRGPRREPERDRPAAFRPAARHTASRGKAQAPVFYVAGFWRRLVAAAVDSAIIVPVALLLGWIVGAIAGVHLPPSRHRGIDFWLDLLLANDPALIGIVGLTLAVATVYALVFQIVLARTPGMRIMKMRIIDQYGDLLTTGRAAARTAGYLAAVATLGLGFIWIGFDSEKRGLHDWLSGTYVVKA